MSEIIIRCDQQTLSVLGSPLIASGGVNENTLKATFCDTWEGYTKTAVFYQDEKNVYYAVLDKNNTCVIPWEVLQNEGVLNIGVFGVKDDVRITSNVIRYKVKFGAITENLKPSVPSDDIYQQIIEKYNEVRKIVENIPTDWENYYNKNEIDNKLNVTNQNVTNNANAISDLSSNVEQIANNQIPDEYLEKSVDDYVANNSGGFATKNDVSQLSSEIENLSETNCVNYLGILPDIEEQTSCGVTYSCKNGVYTFRGTTTSALAIKLIDSPKELPEWWRVGNVLRVHFKKTDDSTKNIPVLQFYKYNEDRTITRLQELTGVNDTIVTMKIPPEYIGHGLQVRIHLSAGHDVNATITNVAITNTLSNNELVDELSAVNDELSAVNDELSAVNDELSAVNDELSAVNDELSAVNDELSAVNGKNIINPVTLDETIQNGITYSAIDGIYEIEGTATNACNIYLVDNKKALPKGVECGKTYNICYKCEQDIYFRVAFFNAENTSGYIACTVRTWDKITIPDGTIGMTLRLYVPTGTTINRVRVHPVFTEHIGGEDLLEFVKPLDPGPMLTIIDDDGHIKFMEDLLPIIESKHIPIATAVTTTRIGSDSKWLTWEQIQECYARGAEVLCHTYDHNPTLPESVDDLVYQYTLARNAMYQHGLMGADILVYNNATGANAKAQEAASRVFKCGIYAGGATIENIKSLKPYYLRRFPVDTGDTAWNIDYMCGLIDQLKDSNGWMIWIMHTSGANWDNTALDALNNAIDYAIENDIPIVSADCGYRHFVTKHL